ncbi:unnamed protein product [marine sediment metagenome]|uniref:Uncharacterized protein n=1 Tax=marine sediment metagenome TaxID=412755 RepID=X0UEP1_9ZZZZ
MSLEFKRSLLESTKALYTSNLKTVKEAWPDFIPETELKRSLNTHKTLEYRIRWYHEQNIALAMVYMHGPPTTDE